MTRVENPTPIPFLMDKQVRSIAAGREHVLALTSTSQVYSWGSNTDGRLGHNDYSDRWTPTLVDKLTRKGGKDRVVTVVGAGDAHSLAAFDGGRRVYTWGRGAHGRLGTGRHLNKVRFFRCVSFF